MSPPPTKRPPKPAGLSTAPSKHVSSSPRPPTTIAPTAVIADKALLIGIHPIIIAENVVVHPHAKLISTYGSLTIGPGCIIAERAVVGPTSGMRATILEANVTVESGAVVEAAIVDEGTIVETAAVLGAGAVVGSYCRISASCGVIPDEVLPDFTVVFGAGQRRIDRTMERYESIREMRGKGQLQQVELLRRLIPSNARKWAS
ncbi:trimeric LpxA-like protein [Cryomyces antarcticus]|uniref:Dynactin subunit 6 n=1 Tax=Cryomyces antarcticus TaxID=329879 RepID=A0ABR0M8Q1_9PEZI|nr:hypothetical protein LTR39_000790 [Cryomyces antarcticus]KAK5020459.1 hypothetical protein LTR60_000500 [Cryomyces antarcticus]KAK5295347.1 hypothetical protein LTR16_001045 [Cryomyces antarcticus]